MTFQNTGMAPSDATSQSGTSILEYLFQCVGLSVDQALEKLDAGQHVGALFDPVYVGRALKAKGLAQDGLRPSDIARLWEKHATDAGITPTPLIDTSFYLSRNADVASSGMDPVLHFLTFGLKEGRPPCAILATGLGHVSEQASKDDGGYLLHFFRTAPARIHTVLRDEHRFNYAQAMAHPEFFAFRAGLEAPCDAAYVFWAHAFGSHPEAPVSVLFNTQYYMDAWNRQLEEDENSATAGSDEGVEELTVDTDHNAYSPLGDGQDAYLHWLIYGRPAHIIPTPLFDEAHYTHIYKDLKSWKRWIFDHYVLHGVYERRHPSLAFEAQRYARERDLDSDVSPLLDYAIRGEAEGIFPCQTINPLRVAPPGPGIPTRLDLVCMKLEDKARKLQRPEMQVLIEHAASIEPLVMRPYGQRQVQYPPIRHTAVEQLKAGTQLRKATPKGPFETVVLVPHCRMAGSARVAGALVKAISTIAPDERVLLVLTDRTDFERPDWFGDKMDVFNMAELAETNPHIKSVPLLMDLLRGIAPKRVININSKLAWDLFALYSKQLQHEMDLYAYLFTWDLDIHGNRGGYPIRYFQQTFDNMKRVFIDNIPLKNEFVQRYHLSDELAERLCVVHTPSENPYNMDCSTMFETRRQQHRALKFLWAGRFDRQKRFDLVIDIAHRRPDIEIWAYGKAVINDQPDLDLENIPPNLKLMGTYRNFEDLPIDSIDGFLYTSQWDGLPTILIDVAARGIPAVASAVGGTVDLIREDTAYPVTDMLNPEAYIEAIDAMVANPAEVTRRCRNLRQHTLQLCSSELYLARLSVSMED